MLPLPGSWIQHLSAVAARDTAAHSRGYKDCQQHRTNSPRSFRSVPDLAQVRATASSIARRLSACGLADGAFPLEVRRTWDGPLTARGCTAINLRTPGRERFCFSLEQPRRTGPFLYPSRMDYYSRPPLARNIRQRVSGEPARNNNDRDVSRQRFLSKRSCTTLNYP